MREAADRTSSAVLLVDAGARRDGPEGLAAALRATLGDGWVVRTATLDPDPRSTTDLEATVATLAADGAGTLVVVSTSPQFDPGAGARALGAVYRGLGRTTAPITLRTHPCWHDDAGYVSALARGVAEVASEHGLSPADTHLRFVAPRPAGGDPWVGAYRARLQRTMELVADRVGWPLHAASLGFEREVEARDPDGRVLVCPLSPVACPTARREGIHVSRPLCDSPAFVAALKRLVLKGARPVPPGKRAPEPLLRAHRSGPGRCTADRRGAPGPPRRLAARGARRRRGAARPTQRSARLRAREEVPPGRRRLPRMDPGGDPRSRGVAVEHLPAIGAVRLAPLGVGCRRARRPPRPSAARAVRERAGGPRRDGPRGTAGPPPPPAHRLRTQQRPPRRPGRRRPAPRRPPKGGERRHGRHQGDRARRGRRRGRPGRDRRAHPSAPSRPGTARRRSGGCSRPTGSSPPRSGT